MLFASDFVNIEGTSENKPVWKCLASVWFWKLWKQNEMELDENDHRSFVANSTHKRIDKSNKPNWTHGAHRSHWADRLRWQVENICYCSNGIRSNKMHRSQNLILSWLIIDSLYKPAQLLFNTRHKQSLYLEQLASITFIHKTTVYGCLQLSAGIIVHLL